MNDAQKEALQEAIDTIVRDEGYDGAYGWISADMFNNMAARIANLAVEAAAGIVEP